MIKIKQSNTLVPLSIVVLGCGRKIDTLLHYDTTVKVDYSLIPTQSLCSKIVFAKQSIVFMESFVQCLHSFNFLLVICNMDKFLKGFVDPFSSASL